MQHVLTKPVYDCVLRIFGSVKATVSNQGSVEDPLGERENNVGNGENRKNKKLKFKGSKEKKEKTFLKILLKVKCYDIELAVI